jgi:TolA-binding protein
MASAAKGATGPVDSTAPAAPPVGYVSLEDVLRSAGAQFASMDVLENEVTSLQKMLDQLVLGGPESPDKLLEVTGVERELETLGVTAGRAAQISDMSDEVRALRARLQLLNLRAASVTTTDETFKPIEQMQPYDPRAVEGETAAGEETAQEEPAAEPDAAAAAEAAAQAERTPSPDPDREAVLAFRQGDMLGVLDILEGYRADDLAPDTMFVLGSALVTVDRLTDARAVFEMLRARTERSTLARAATRQIERIDHLMNGIVSLPPALERGEQR